MTATEIKEIKLKIAGEMMGKYHEYLNDIQNMNERDFSRKYGYTLESVKGCTKGGKDTQQNFIRFHRNVFSGRYLPGWEKEGYDRKVIWELHQIGFLSCEYNSSWEARHTGRSYFYYIKQDTAKAIYKYFSTK